MENIVNSGNGQTLMDIAIQEYGDLDSVFDLAKANSTGLTTDLQISDSLTLPNVVTSQNDNVVTSLKSQSIQPAAATSESLINPETLEGIGYWEIGVDAKVS